MINVTELCRNYGKFRAVDNVSFSIGKGEIIGLLGHNGAGKTTIMKMLTGFLEPSEGSIEIDGLNMEEQRSEIQGKIGYLPENCPVYPEMTLIDFLDYAAELNGLTSQEKIAAVRKVIKKTALTEKATQPINTLSRGYRQRVGVAQAILHNPEILILDEPTNGLDPTQILHMRELIAELGKTSTVIVSTHILQEVEAVCERVLIMRNGELAVDAKLDDLQNSHSIQLKTDCSPDKLKAQLQDQQGITNINQITQADKLYQYQLNIDNKETVPIESIIADIVSKLSQSGTKIFAIYPEQQDLETIFRQVNSMPGEPTGGQIHEAA